MSKKEKDKEKQDIITEVVNILEELASALVIALLVIGFVVQPFIIPTGSMAETLMGAHYRFYCPQCGYRYDLDYRESDNRVPNQKIFPPVSRCPSCGYYYDPTEPVHVAKGDKILALKFLYQFLEPQRWDVVVFKNPTSPNINYIKRLIGRPNEKVEIIDGDIYINDRIARKPPKVQDELWIIVYDGDYVPVKPNVHLFNGHAWQPPMKNYGQSNWRTVEGDKSRFVLSTLSGRENQLVYDSDVGNDFRATYAYDGVDQYGLLPICRDLMVRFYAEFRSDSPGRFVGAGLRKYRRYYKARVDDEGRMVIVRADGDKEQILAEKNIDAPAAVEPVMVKFSNVDHLLKFEFDGQELHYDLGRAPGDAGPYLAEAEPEVEILASGELEVSHIAVYRDIYYLDSLPGRRPHKGLGAQGNPIKLSEDEFFVLGDNSPASADSRFWAGPGIGNNGIRYRQGIVPRDYLVGKAFVVFWPSGFRPFEKFPFRIVPDVRQIRLIYGGSDRILQNTP